MRADIKLLIVDDERVIRQSVADYFEDREWEVFTADSGEAGLAFLETQTCDAAIVDIRMGGMDGEAFIGKAARKYPQMRFVVCTGSPEYLPSETIIGLPNVAGNVFSKPVTDLGLLETALLALLEQQ